MSSYAYYRLPYADTYTRLIQRNGEPLRLLSYAQLDGQEGFVFAPFSITEECPLLLLQPDEITEGIKVGTEEDGNLEAVNADGAAHDGIGSPTLSYHIAFSNFHAQIADGNFRKLVLARCDKVSGCPSLDAEQLFLRACRLYPRLFVALVSTPFSGTWLMATPEILLEGSDSAWRTIALAGTMQLHDEQLAFDTPLRSASEAQEEQAHIAWNSKNIQEQRYVATYVIETLEQFASRIDEEGPRTVRAGHLVHLRSDFNFTLPDTNHLGSLLQALHPTPAVCGLPKREAWQFILRNEYAPRRYYSGFAGMLQPTGDTHLYVSLRCMEILQDHCLLYAGGGLLRDSVEQQEWEETEAKMQTMRKLFQR